MDATFDAFQSLSHQLAWLWQTRLASMSIASLSSQVTSSVLGGEHIKLLSDAVRRAHTRSSRRLIILPLQEGNLRVVFADACFWQRSAFLNSAQTLCKLMRRLPQGKLFALH